ncbi:TonB-dependent receptor [Bordetella sputigena]|uniref:TonB-dependent receptor domain-containing protein n=1 Tax=Bordetella sputigena TaxID=1416810 RepID=UPI0039EE2D4A
MKPLFTRRSAGLLACLAPMWAAAQQNPAATAAQPPVTQLDTVVVTATRSPEPLKDVLGDVSVIDRATLESAGQSSLAEVLSRTHGIEYANNGGPQTVTSLFMRGANSNQTLVLVDGQRVNNATNGLAALNAIPTNSIDRVEIVRGAASSLYGADALGGVINIITKRDADRPLSAYASVGGGTYGSSSYSAGLSGAARGWTYSLSSSYQQSRGFDATNDKNFLHNPDRDSYYENNLAGSLGYEWMRGQTLTAQFYQTHVNGGYDNGTPYFNDRSIQDLQGYSLTSINRLTDMWTSTLRVGSTLDRNRSENVPGDENPFNTPDGKSTFRTRQNQYLWQNDLQFTKDQKVTLAYEHLDQRVEGDIGNFNNFPVTFGDYSETRRHVNSFTGVYLGDFGAHHLQASLRNDDNSQFGNRTTGGLTYGYDITNRIRATVGANTGFRAPNFNELYWPNDGGFVGNPDLKPETSRNIEASLRYQDDDSELGATYYHNKVKNLIINQAIDPNDPFSVFQPFNVSHALLEGVSLTGMKKFGDTRLRASLDLSDPRNTDEDTRLPQRARKVLRVSADHRFGDFLLGAEMYASGDRIDALTGDRLGGYTLYNLLASYDLTRNLQVQVRWNNVFDKEYTLVKGYNTPGSNAFVNLTWRM